MSQIADSLGQRIAPSPASAETFGHLDRLGLHACRITERRERGSARFLGTHPPIHELSGAHLEVELDLFPDLVSHVGAEKQDPKSAPDPVGESHRSVLGHGTLRRRFQHGGDSLRVGIPSCLLRLQRALTGLGKAVELRTALRVGDSPVRLQPTPPREDGGAPGRGPLPRCEARPCSTHGSIVRSRSHGGGPTPVTVGSGGPACL